MSKKKDKPQVVNNIEEINLEIDYEKLAEAIVIAQEKESKKSEEKSKKRMGARQFLMAWCNGILYAVLYSYVIREIIEMWQNYASSGEPSLYMCIVYTIGGASLAVLLFLAHQETMNDSKEDTITHFNTNIALVALIAAIVALVKG